MYMVSLRPQRTWGSRVPGLSWVSGVGAQGESAARWRYRARTSGQGPGLWGLVSGLQHSFRVLHVQGTGLQ